MRTKYLKVEKGIAIPERFQTRKNKKIRAADKSERQKYPFSLMGIGDSFSVAWSDNYKVRMAAYAFGRNRNMKFLTRVGELRGKKTVRVWRTE